jgi:taurine dioxygenase
MHLLSAAVKFAPLTVTLGSEVSQVDLNQLDAAMAEDMYINLLDRGVLVFRDQNISSATHVALGESFGPLAARHPLYPGVEGFEHIIRVRNDENNPPENEEWHSDLSCRTNPPFVSILRGALIPPVGGDTLWSDMRAVHDHLPNELRSKLEQHEALHSLAHGFRFLADFAASEAADADEQRARLATLTALEAPTNTTTHPMIVRHRATDRPVVYVNESFTKSVLGLEAEESDRLLADLFLRIRNPRYQMRVRWTQGTVVMWDNWATQHFASGDHYPAPREVQRVTVGSDRRSGSFTR